MCISYTVPPPFLGGEEQNAIPERPPAWWFSDCLFIYLHSFFKIYLYMVAIKACCHIFLMQTTGCLCHWTNMSFCSTERLKGKFRRQVRSWEMWGDEKADDKEKPQRQFVQFDWSHEVKVTGEKCLLMHTVWTADRVSTCTNADASSACWSAKDTSLWALSWWPETWMATTAQQQSWHQMKTGKWAVHLKLRLKHPIVRNTRCFTCSNMVRP